MPCMGRDRQVGAVPNLSNQEVPCTGGDTQSSWTVVGSPCPDALPEWGHGVFLDCLRESLSGCPARMGTRSLLGLSSGVLVRMPCTSGDTQSSWTVIGSPCPDALHGRGCAVFTDCHRESLFACPARAGMRSLHGLPSGVLVRMPCTSGDTQVGAGPNLSNQESTCTGVCTYRQEYSKAMPPATLSREEMLICTGRQIVAEVLPERAPSPGNPD
jgi:hypothetical protein